MSRIYDVAIIGAGPVGLYAAATAGEYKLSTILIDALPQVGGQLTALYPKKYIFDVAGHPNVTAEELVAQLKEQALHYDPDLLLGFKVTEMQRQEDGSYRILSEGGDTAHSRFVILAAGAGIIQPRRLQIEDADKYLGHGLEYVVSDIESYRGKRVLVIGGGDTALDWANFFTEIDCEVFLAHRTDRFVGFEGSLQKLQDSGASIFTHTVITGVFGNGVVAEAELSNRKEGWKRKIAVDRILVCIGFVPKLGFLKESELEIAESSVKADGDMRTNLPGVYAVGDISNHPGRLKLISTGFGNVRRAISDIGQSLPGLSDK